MPTRITPRRAVAAVLLTAAVSLPGAALHPATAHPATAADATDPSEVPSSFTLRDQRIVESSGLQASHRHRGVYWTHNDSGFVPELYAVDSETGETVATLTLTGVTGRDIEAIGLGPDGDLYVGDIGDNQGGTWPEVWIYRVPEPARLADATVTPTVYTVQYDDGPRDAEALMVHPDTGRVYIVSKEEGEVAGLYAGPAKLSADGVNTFERVSDIDLWVTDGAFSPDGTRLALRGYFTAQMYRWRKSGAPEPIHRQLSVPIQTQGESVTFTPDGGALWFGSEGAGSTVQPAVLEGELLPDSARPDGGGTSAGQDDSLNGGEPGAAGEQDGGNTTRVVGTVLAAALAVFALRRLLRRRRAGTSA